jgi:hypothetical protein
MSYSDFKTVLEVTNKFDIEVMDKTFIDTLEIEIPGLYFTDITKKLMDSMSFINEVTVCENIIRPILNLVGEKYNALYIWSHVPYNVAPNEGLKGEPDYLVAQRTKQGGMLIPPICIMEAKQEKLEEGWAQTLAEMTATFKQGANISYGVVTTGKAWEFGQLENNVFTKDPNQISATMDLQKVFDVLNWLFSMANANLIKT